MLGLVIGVLVSVAYYAYVEHTLPQRIIDLVSIDVSPGEAEPPTPEEVKQRAEVLETQSFILGLGTMLCLEAPRLVADAEYDMKRKYPDHHDVALYDIHQLDDTRMAWDILDDYENLIKGLVRACG